MAEPAASRYVPRRPDWREYSGRLDALRESRYNLDLDQRERFTEAEGWHLDHHEADLVPEPPGPPLPPDDARASWAVACDLLRDYAFPDPSLVTGIFSPDEPLAGRPMLLRARFLGFTFWFGVRVVDEIEGVRPLDTGPVHVYGYNYATLEGHFEMGQISFEVRKHAPTGRVDFHIDAFSKPDRIRNPFYRIGFKLFGRRLQLRFARTALERMQRFVREELAARAEGVEAPDHETVEPEPPPPDAAAAMPTPERS